MHGTVLGLAGGLGLAAFPLSREEKRWGVSPQPELPRAGSELSATLRIGVTLAGHVLRHSAPCPPDLANAQNHGAAGPEPRG